LISNPAKTYFSFKFLNPFAKLFEKWVHEQISSKFFESKWMIEGLNLNGKD